MSFTDDCSPKCQCKDCSQNCVSCEDYAEEFVNGCPVKQCSYFSAK